MLDLDAVTHLLVSEESPEDGIMYPGGTPVPPSLYSFVRGLVKVAGSHASADFSVTFMEVVFRAYRIDTLNGVQYSFRRMREVSTLQELRIASPVVDQLLSSRLNAGGLLIVSGAQGNGKSTTCASVVVERLNKHGGLCVTVEDPVEIKMQGRHGAGLCLQRQLDDQSSFAGAVRGSLRAYPPESNSMMMIGEVRDAETASLALRSAVDGRLVIVSLHASGIVAALHRIISLSAEKIGEREARSLLASGFRCVLHQKLVIKTLKLAALFDTESVVGKIHNSKGSLELLRSDIELQRNQMLNKKHLELRSK